jgi:hypothetical protein
MADGALNTVFTQEEFDKIKAASRRNHKKKAFQLPEE